MMSNAQTAHARQPAIQAFSDRSEAFFDLSPDLLGVVSAANKCWVAVNPAFQRILGYEPAYMISRRPIEFVHPDDVAQCREVESTIELGDTVRIENRIRRADGTYAWISWTLIPDAARHEVFCIGREITKAPHGGEMHARHLIEHLETSLEELEAIYDRAPIGLALIDSELRFKRINRRLAEINGAPAVDHLGRVVWDIVPDLRATAEPALRAVLETGCTIENHEIVGTTSGAQLDEHRWREHFYPVEQKGARSVAIICEDVTEQYRAERELAENERRLRVALEGAKAGVWEWEFETGATFWSPEMYELLGLPANATPSIAAFAACIIEEDREKTLAAFRTAAENGSSKFEFEFRIRRNTGDIAWLSAVGCYDRDDDGKPVRARGMNQDITARKRIKLQLERREMQLREALKAGQVFAYDWDRTTDKTERSGNAAQILGESEQDMLVTGHAYLARVHADDREAVRAATTERTPESPQYEVSYRFVRPDGETVWIEETGAASFDAAGRLTGVHGICRDITARRRTEAQNRLLMGEISHRAKNMLAVLQAVVRFTKADTVAEFSAAITHRVQALARVQGLLATSGWTSSDLATILASELEPFGGVDGERIRLEGPPVLIKAHAIQTLILVLHELATNAAKYGALSSPTGRVKVQWRAKADGRLEIVWQESGGPEVTAPRRKGFGSRLIKESLHHLGGGAELAFEPSGLRCSIVIGRSSTAAPAQNGPDPVSA